MRTPALVLDIVQPVKNLLTVIKRAAGDDRARTVTSAEIDFVIEMPKRRMLGRNIKEAKGAS